MKPVINYIEVPSKLEEDINRGKTTWRNGKCVMLDEGRHATVYIGHKEETRYDVPPEGEASERQATMAFPVRVKKPLTKAKVVNAAEMQAYALADALEVSSLAASLARKHRENINDLDVKEHDEFIAWVKRELDASGLFTQSETRVDAESPTLGDLVATGRLAARGDTDMTDTQRAKVSRLFPTWDELVAKGEQLPVGTGLQYGGDFYKVVQAHTPQSDWKPSEQHALYAYVSDHEGTQDDPIPYRHWMLLEQGKYYTENGKTYRCTQSPGAGYGSDLEELSQFVEPII